MEEKLNLETLKQNQQNLISILENSSEISDNDKAILDTLLDKEIESMKKLEEFYKK